MSILHIFIAILAVMFWGLNFVAAKYALAYFPFFFLLAIRLSIVSMVLFPFIIQKLPISLTKIYKISLTLAVIHFSFMFSGLKYGIDVSIAVIIDQLKVPFAVMLGFFLLSERVSKKEIIGIIVALIGTFILVGTPNVQTHYIAAICLVISAFAWAFYNIQAKNINSVNVLPFIGWISLLSAPQLMILSLIFEGNNFHLLVDIPTDVFLSILYMVLGASIFAHGAWYYLLKIYPVSKIVPYSLLVPVFGIFFGIILLNELMIYETIIGAIVTIIGVGIILYNKRVKNKVKNTI